MKIALFTETYLPAINGVVTHVKLLKEGLERHGHDVLVVCADAKTKKYYIEDGVMHCPAHESKKFYGFGIATPISPKRQKLIKEYNPDIIHIHNEFGIGFSGFMIAKALKKPLVYTLHTMYDDYIYYISNKVFAPIVKRITHSYAKRLAKSASALTGPSKKVEEYFRLCGVKKEVNIIPNPVEIDIFLPENVDENKKHEFRLKYNIPESSTVACFCGRLGKEKGLTVALNFWAQAVGVDDDFRFVIIGDGPEREALERLSKSLKIDHQVIFTGKVEHNDLPPYYACCDLYLTTSTSDTNSISMLEGMASGLPTLSIIDPLNAGQVTDGVNGYNFSSPQQMYEQLKLIRNMDKDELEDFRHRVRLSVERAGAERFAQYLIDIYNKISNQKGRDESANEVFEELT